MKQGGGVMSKGTILIAAALVMLVSCGAASAQDAEARPSETLTLDQAVALALRNNHSVKVAQLAVARAD
jgi:ABC-type glycerol-3-phosphate transport system substrate-binding protein